MTERRTRSPSLRAKLALVFVPTLLILAAVEGGTRLFLWFSFGQQVPARWTFEYEPYLVTKRSGRIFETPPKAADQYRVLVIGGSTAAQIPKEILRGALAPYTDLDVVVMNLAEGGYILNQERVALALRGVPAEPDLLISLDGVNDIVTASKLHETGLTHHADLVSLAVEEPFLNFLLSVVRRSQFFAAVSKWRERRDEREFRGRSDLAEQTLDHVMEGWRSIAITAKGMEVPYLQVLQPYLYLRQSPTEDERALQSYAYRRSFMNQMIRDLGERIHSASLPGETYSIDSTRFFDRSEGVTVFRDEVHLTREGNEIFARELLRIATGRGLEIPPKTRSEP